MRDEEGTLNVEDLRELAHRELEIARLMGPSDKLERGWVLYLEHLVKITDAWLAFTRNDQFGWSDRDDEPSMAEHVGHLLEHVEAMGEPGAFVRTEDLRRIYDALSARVER